MADTSKRKLQKKAPPLPSGHYKMSAYTSELGSATTPSVIEPTHHEMRFGDPSHNTNAGNPKNSIGMQMRGVKMAKRRKRNIGRS
jgi:hypothetical protein